jgi:hypothetical protein
LPEHPLQREIELPIETKHGVLIKTGVAFFASKPPSPSDPLILRFDVPGVVRVPSELLERARPVEVVIGPDDGGKLSGTLVLGTRPHIRIDWSSAEEPDGPAIMRRNYPVRKGQ